MCCKHNTEIKRLLWIIKEWILINTESDKKREEEKFNSEKWEGWEEDRNRTFKLIYK